MWKEFINESGLGSSLSHDGYEKMAQFIYLALGLQFENVRRNDSKRYIGLPTPVRLCLTADYANSPVMSQILRERQLSSTRPNSTGSYPQPNVQQLPPPFPQGAQGNDRDMPPAVRPIDQAERAEEPNYNEGELSVRERIEKRHPLNLTVDELKEKLRKLTLDKIMEKKASDEQHRRQITSLNNDITNYQASEENQYRKITKYKEEVNKLKAEIEIRDNSIENLKTCVQNQLEQKAQLQDQYDFLKRIHENQKVLIKDEWDAMVQSLRSRGVDVAEHFSNVTSDMMEEPAPKPKDKKQKKKSKNV